MPSCWRNQGALGMVLRPQRKGLSLRLAPLPLPAHGHALRLQDQTVTKVLVAVPTQVLAKAPPALRVKVSPAWPVRLQGMAQKINNMVRARHPQSE
mmetsp:Transcript_113069/g.330462  ORF Transcript_113069/g.330462 Transcript_113069/m.330462 type:complete len:96 (-) Transcript_113069:1618-1905(-)